MSLKHYIFSGLFVSSIMLHGHSLVQKYPSYLYVLSEFDIDSSYIYDDYFVDFAKKNDSRMRRFYKNALKRGASLLPTMQGLLLDDGLSDVFIYLSIVESGLATDAISSKNAAGLWQFMPATAKAYDLAVCNSYDERCDTSSATRAAIRYLQKLHTLFGKWYLAVMAYNCGEGCVKKAIKKAGSDALYILTDERLKYLPRETRMYIKKILLVAMIGESNLLDVYQETPENIIQVDVAGGTGLDEMAHLLHMDKKVLYSLNKSVKKGIFPMLKKRYKMTIPLDKVYAFYLRYDIDRHTEDTISLISHMVSYRVKLGDTLEKIAQKYDTDIEKIMQINHLESDALVLGTVLVIPVSEKKFENLEK